MKRLKFLSLDMDTLRSKILQQSCKERLVLIQNWFTKMLYVTLSLRLIRGKICHNSLKSLVMNFSTQVQLLENASI